MGSRHEQGSFVQVAGRRDHAAVRGPTAVGPEMATFVIVHGAWSGAHAWRWVRPLREARHEVFTPARTGLGERAHLATPATDLDKDIADVAAVGDEEAARTRGDGWKGSPPSWQPV